MPDEIKLHAQQPSINPGSRSQKIFLSANIRKIDNGFILSVNKDSPKGYESAELAVTSIPKLLKAIGTFFKDEDED